MRGSSSNSELRGCAKLSFRDVAARQDIAHRRVARTEQAARFLGEVGRVAEVGDRDRAQLLLLAVRITDLDLTGIVDGQRREGADAISVDRPRTESR